MRFLLTHHFDPRNQILQIRIRNKPRLLVSIFEQPLLEGRTLIVTAEVQGGIGFFVDDDDGVGHDLTAKGALHGRI